ncbi:MAG: DUF308 domain-containing protein [Bacilli bacterium]|nr:DUF308 domain-containing protein [Bacilli bacterium]
MKKKQITDLSTGIILVAISVIILMFPTFKITNVKYILGISLILYTLVNFIKYIITHESKDKEGLYTALISLAIALIVFFSDMSKPKNLALTLFSFVILMVIMRIIKADYYHDRHNKMWMLEVVSLILFMLAGYLTCVNLYYSADIQIIVLGFFFFINGMFEIYDPIIIGYIRGR